MSTEIILTHDQIRAAIDEAGPDNYFGLSRAIEQAVLQSPEVQALREDAGRYQFIRDGDQEVWCSSGDDLLTHENLDSAIDGAMEQKT